MSNEIIEDRLIDMLKWPGRNEGVVSSIRYTVPSFGVHFYFLLPFKGKILQILVLESNRALEFDEAKLLAVDEAAKYLKEPMILSWLNHRTGQHSPNVECCQEDGKESWEIYAESRGGTVRVEIAGQYTFILRDGCI